MSQGQSPHRQGSVSGNSSQGPCHVAEEAAGATCGPLLHSLPGDCVQVLFAAMHPWLGHSTGLAAFPPQLLVQSTPVLWSQEQAGRERGVKCAEVAGTRE